MNQGTRYIGKNGTQSHIQHGIYNTGKGWLGKKKNPKSTTPLKYPSRAFQTRKLHNQIFYHLPSRSPSSRRILDQLSVMLFSKAVSNITDTIHYQPPKKMNKKRETHLLHLLRQPPPRIANNRPNQRIITPQKPLPAPRIRAICCLRQLHQQRIKLYP